MNGAMIEDGGERVVAGVARESDRGFQRLVGGCARFRQVVNRARQLAYVDAPVLLLGETGVGKEIFARALHDGGRCPEAPFVALNCGGLSRELLASELFGYVDGAFTGARRTGMVGKVEAARGGTLFLDEIGEMPLDLQPYLLRVLESGEIYPLGSNKPRTVQFRLVAACNRNLRAEVASGRFREDLYYRISATSLQIPALRERKEDLPLLVAHFAAQVTARQGQPAKYFQPEILLALSRYAWPGNLRELRNVVEVMVLLAATETVDLTALPPDFPPQPLDDGGAAKASGLAPTDGGLAEAEREVIDAALHLRRGNLARVAKDLGISRSTLYLKVKKYKLDGIVADVRIAAHRLCADGATRPALP
ncbi:MAG: sigma-54 dependent transcriptional regulator, acetoin dehydrogenase operon transcriptional [Myxococcales bacterium]|jgi:transcriptional regulator with PAS, ATPase and Fis domain|nr:sigma-54 dependent transcriptional regulator, acetoin dehydrogenase operon transcriptional [Myxococcales bacterium]